MLVDCFVVYRRECRAMLGEHKIDEK